MTEALNDRDRDPPGYRPCCIGLECAECSSTHGSQVMQEIVSFRDVSRHLSHFLERVEQGAEIIITRRGKPIARMLPIPEAKQPLTDAQRAARERLRERMGRGYALGGTRSDRDSLHGSRQ